MNILFYTQVGWMGGSLRLLTNFAKYLAQSHEVTLAAPNLNLKNLQNVNFKWIDLNPKTVLEDQFDMALCHFPYGKDNYIQKLTCKKVLVVFEIMGILPLKQEIFTTHFEKAIHVHREQLPSLLKFFKEEDCVLLPIINDIDFKLPFKKTMTSASIGSGHFKNNLPLVQQILENSPAVAKHIMFGLFENAVGNGRLQFAGYEWGIEKLFASFDCLVHTPRAGNGTSMVVSDALACGKEVILSPIKGYIEAYGKLTGVSFLDKIEANNISSIIDRYSEERSNQIATDYAKVYNRKEVLDQWVHTFIGR